jgi:multifunctional methyltransferase subunit TRM112
MKVLTHNSLKSTVRDVAKGYPLLLNVTNMEVKETVVLTEFIRDILPSLDWQGILQAASAVGFEGLPDMLNADQLDDDEFIEAMHKLLMDVEIIEGTLTCPETGKVFPIKNGIPDMVLPESEV